MKLWYEHPVAEEHSVEILDKNIKRVAREGTEVHHGWLKVGYSDPTYVWTEMYNAVEAVRRYYEAWKTGYDGIVIGCYLDIGLIQARSIVDIPVTGVCESSILIASCLGAKFSVVTIHRAIAPQIAHNIKRYGMGDRLASVRYLKMSPVEARALHADPPKLVNAFTEVAVEAIREDEAEVIIPGCTIVSTLLTAQNVYEIEKVPVIDPVWAGIKMAEVLVDLKQTCGLGVCRLGYYAAPIDWDKEIPITF